MYLLIKNSVKQAKPETFKNSFKNSSQYVLTLMKVVIFFSIFQAYMIFKYVYISYTFTNIQQITNVFNATEYTETDLILSLNVEKEFLYDESNPILSSVSRTVFFSTVLNISNSLENMIKVYILLFILVDLHRV